jgi:hypothetical protein
MLRCRCCCSLLPASCRAVGWHTHQHKLRCSHQVHASRARLNQCSSPVSCGGAANSFCCCCCCSFPLWSCDGLPAGRLRSAEPVPGCHAVQVGECQCQNGLVQEQGLCAARGRWISLLPSLLLQWRRGGGGASLSCCRSGLGLCFIGSCWSAVSASLEMPEGKAHASITPFKIVDQTHGRKPRRSRQNPYNPSKSALT